jgi:hypothetical protein
VEATIVVARDAVSELVVEGTGMALDTGGDCAQTVADAVDERAAGSWVSPVFGSTKIRC